MGGSVKVFGADVQGPTSAVRYLVQDYDSFPWLTVRENLALCMNERSDLHISKLLAEVGLDTFSNALPHTLSGGMRKRLGLARALAAQARIILLDEPFASLDVSARNDLYAVLHRVNTLHGSSFIIVTHDVDEAVFISHRVIVGTPRPFIIREIVSTERIRFPRGPTVRLDPAFEQIVTHVRDLLTQTATHPKDI
jgi:ABC-type nitrate/sulfonate/bicarbonate transport system ATPase subunit